MGRGAGSGHRASFLLLSDPLPAMICLKYFFLYLSLLLSVGFSARWLWLQSMGSAHRLSCLQLSLSGCGRNSIVEVHRLSCSAACGVFPDQASNLGPLHWQAVSSIGPPGKSFNCDFRSAVLRVGSQDPAASSIPWTVLEMQVLRPQPRHSDQTLWGEGLPPGILIHSQEQTDQPGVRAW